LTERKPSIGGNPPGHFLQPCERLWTQFAIKTFCSIVFAKSQY